MKNYSIKNASRIIEVLLNYKLANCKLPDGYIEIKFLQNLKDGCCFCYWYGEDVVSIKYKGRESIISANGDIRATLSDKKTGDEIAYVKDKSNNGVFYDEMHPYIKNDAELLLLLNDEHPKYQLYFDNNNWWDLCFCDSKGEEHYDYDALDYDSVLDAIIEVIEDFEDLIAEEEKEA